MDVNRRNFLGAGAVAGIAIATGMVLPAIVKAEKEKTTLVTAGIITDMHHTTKEDTLTRKYSASQSKMEIFINRMKKEKPAFVIEMGDFVDALAKGTDPGENFKEIETLFTSYEPHYHVLGNHEFSNLTREFILKSIANTGIPPGTTWYSWDAGGVHFIVLDADYTPKVPHRPYDMNTPEDSFWTWKDTFVPPVELEWLTKDLLSTNLPTVVFTHQTLDRVDDQDHNIKNASEVRKIFEESGKVLAVFSGHDHQGGYSNIKDIHYIVLTGNVSVHDSRSWETTSRENGFGKVKDNQFALLKIDALGEKSYSLTVNGFGRQPSYELIRVL